MYYTTLVLSSSTYPTMGDLRESFWIIRMHLDEQVNSSENEYLLANSIRHKLNEYWNLMDENSKISAFLDPRSKFSTFDTNRQQDFTVRMRALLSSYSTSIGQTLSNNGQSSVPSMTTFSSHSSSITRTEALQKLQEIANRHRTNSNSVIGDELERYISLRVDRNCDPLIW